MKYHIYYENLDMYYSHYDFFFNILSQQQRINKQII